MSIQPSRFVFREAQDVTELESLFRLRYQGYLNSSCSSLVRPNEYGLEFDGYDWYAHHLGLFQEGQYGASPLGYMRLVQDKPAPMAPLVSRLAAQFHDLAPPSAPPASAPLPVIASCPQKERLLSLYRSKIAIGQSIAEGSRFVFSPEARAAGFARFVFECTLASAFFRYGYDYALLACHPRHAPFYLQYGFKQLLGGGRNDYRGLSASVLGIGSGEIASRRAAHIKAMAGQCRANGAFYLLPNNRKASAPAV